MKIVFWFCPRGDNFDKLLFGRRKAFSWALLSKEEVESEHKYFPFIYTECVLDFSRVKFVRTTFQLLVSLQLNRSSLVVSCGG